jgi:hypothetical protein
MPLSMNHSPIAGRRRPVPGCCESARGRDDGVRQRAASSRTAMTRAIVVASGQSRRKYNIGDDRFVARASARFDRAWLIIVSMQMVVFRWIDRR